MTLCRKKMEEEMKEKDVVTLRRTLKGDVTSEKIGEGMKILDFGDIRTLWRGVREGVSKKVRGCYICSRTCVSYYIYSFLLYIHIVR